MITFKNKPTKRRILGLDISTKTGWVCLEGDKKEVHQVSYGELHYKDLKGLPRLNEFYKAIQALVIDTETDFVITENYGFANKHTLVTLVEVGTIVRFALFNLNIPYAEVAPSSLKKFVTGKGNSKKDQIMKEVYKRWGFEGTDNECDAYGLAMFGASLLCDLGEIKLPQTNLQTVVDWTAKNTKFVQSVAK